MNRIEEIDAWELFSCGFGHLNVLVSKTNELVEVVNDQMLEIGALLEVTAKQREEAERLKSRPSAQPYATNGGSTPSKVKGPRS